MAGLFGSGIGNQIVKGALSLALKLYTPKGEADPDIWIRSLKVDEEEGVVSLTIKAPLLEFQAWALLNLRKAGEEFLDLEDGKDLLHLNAIPDSDPD